MSQDGKGISEHEIAYYFVKANSPYDAVGKVLKRVDEAMKAGQFVDEGEQE